MAAIPRIQTGPPDPPPWRTARIWVGTSGYTYPHWRRGAFYPEGLAAAAELEYFAQRFSTVELNNPFYCLPSPETFEGWRLRSPKGFLFAVKASRYITHIKKLNQPKQAAGLFLERTARLGRKLGPILFQFPRQWRCHPERLEQFLRVLPKRRRYAFEFRHVEWFNEEVYGLLRRRGAAFCWAVHPQLPPVPPVVTAKFSYIRMHAGQEPSGNFGEKELRIWAEHVRQLPPDHEVFIYFNNDWHGFALHNAVRMRQLLEVPLKFPLHRPAVLKMPVASQVSEQRGSDNRRKHA